MRPYSQLMQFVSKNTVIPKGIERVARDKAIKIEEFCEKIKDDSLNPDDLIFNDPDCELYILHLLKEEKIPETKAYTLLEYLQILRQYTNRQVFTGSTKNTDAIITVISHHEKEEIADHLKKLAVSLQKSGLNISLDQLTLLSGELCGCEKWIVKIELNENNTKDDKDDFEFSSTILALSPWIVSELTIPIDQEIINYFYTFFPFISKLCTLINPADKNIVKLQPIFGSIKPQKLLEIHQNRIHPLTLYSPHIASNLKEAHGYTSITPVTLHDYYHGAIANIFTKEEYEFLFQVLMRAIYSAWPKENASRAIGALNDLDLSVTYAKEEKFPPKVFTLYVSIQLGRRFNHSEGWFKKMTPTCLCEAVQDEEFYLLYQKLLSLHGDTKFDALNGKTASEWLIEVASTLPSMRTPEQIQIIARATRRAPYHSNDVKMVTTITCCGLFSKTKIDAAFANAFAVADLKCLNIIISKLELSKTWPQFKTNMDYFPAEFFKLLDSGLQFWPITTQSCPDKKIAEVTLILKKRVGVLCHSPNPLLANRT